MVHPLRYNSNVTDVIDEHSVQIDVIVGEAIFCFRGSVAERSKALV